MGDEAGDEAAVCAEEEDGEEGDKEGREDACYNGVPGYAGVRADAGEEEVKGCDKRAG